MSRTQVLLNQPTYYAHGTIGQWYADIFKNSAKTILIYEKMPKVIGGFCNFKTKRYHEPHPKAGFADAIKACGLVAVVTLNETGYQKDYVNILRIANVSVDPITGALEFDIVEKIANLA